VTNDAVYNVVLVFSFCLAVAVFVVLFFIAAPYGRHTRKGWGPLIGDKAGWILMEAPSPLLMAAFYFWGRPGTVTALAFLIMWETHYLYRAFLYPLRVRDSQKRMPLSVVAMGALFNVMNAYLNGRYLFVLAAPYPPTWLIHPRFAVGLGLFMLGMLVNRRADRKLLDLRRARRAASGAAGSGGPEYQIPKGGLYRWVSCPNYLGEIVEWIGWALATWSWSGAAFAIWTAANLAPRARSHHRWYRETMPDYPRERKALLPGVW
jgi:protein-S-isoprenylcysteine O-methyltransferase Ste14